MPGEYTYNYPRPMVTTDAVVFRVCGVCLEILLIERKHDPFAGTWALPGGFVDMDETADAAALRELEEETGLAGIALEQFRTFSAVDRDPRGRTISVAYLALIGAAHPDLSAASDAAKAEWFPVDDLPELAFDHGEILQTAREHLQRLTQARVIGVQVLNEPFLIDDLRQVYEAVLGKQLAGDAFHEHMVNDGLVDIDLALPERRYRFKSNRLAHL